jgi:methylthioribose-1-phosphate isomerase
VSDPSIAPLAWRGDSLAVFDQRALPQREAWLECRTVDEVARAIRTLAVRGAPALGIAAAYAIALAATVTRERSAESVLRELESAGVELIATRPTAVNIAASVDRMMALARRVCGDAGATVVRAQEALVAEAFAIHREDRDACEGIGRAGLELVPEGANVLTHCNTGMLCTGGIGTAQGVILTAHRAGRRIHVWVDETRPLFQGARLTAWELGRLGVPRTLVTDGAAASLMAAGRVDLVLVGADRIAADGAVANKIGTYGLAVLARYHGIPFVVAAPLTTVDLAMASRDGIRIEQRASAEVTSPLGVSVAEDGTPVENPAFDVTPPELVSAIVTERGLLRKPYAAALRRAAVMRRSA